MKLFEMTGAQIDRAVESYYDRLLDQYEGRDREFDEYEEEDDEYEYRQSMYEEEM